MLNKMIKSIPVATLGLFDLEIPIIQYGSGAPKVLIINNLHGDEITGFYVLEKLINELPEIIAGTLTIITTANPLGLIHRQRFIPLDEEDINRGFPPLPKARGISATCRKILIEIGLEHDIIIDVHAFTRPCLSAGLLLPQSNEKNTVLAKNILSSVNTDIILSMNINGEEKRTESAYGIYLIKQEKIFVVIEYPPIKFTNNEQVDCYKQGLMRALAVAKILPNMVNAANNVTPVFERQQIISRLTGLFMPLKQLGENVKIDEVIGYMMNIKTLEKEKILSPYDGKLTEIADRQLYRFGEKIATIGKLLDIVL